MSRIAPDIPELQQVPDALRSIVYMRALNRAIRSPLTWLAGGIVIAGAVGIGATQGRALFGAVGAALGTAVGALAALWCGFRVIVPWRARRLVPSFIGQADNSALAQVVEAEERLKRMAAAYERQDARGVRKKDPRDPSRLP
jgi:hypothetical protein